jgi:hypothetical protein
MRDLDADPVLSTRCHGSSIGPRFWQFNGIPAPQVSPRRHPASTFLHAGGFRPVTAQRRFENAPVLA